MGHVAKTLAPLQRQIANQFVDRSACQLLALEADALEFERAVKVQACLARDLHPIARDCALHVSTAGTELSRAKPLLIFIPAQAPRPIGSQRAVYRAGGGVLIDADRRCEKSAYVVHVTLA